MVSSAVAGPPKSEPPAPASPVNAEHRSLFKRLVAADERKLATTIIIALALVGWLAVGLSYLLPQDAWAYQFLFRRSFVQWVLLSAFSIGLVHLLRRIPEWLRERKALQILRQKGVVEGANTLVERRWLQLQAAREEGGRRDIEHFAKSLADHDDSEIDAAYRLPMDIVQILPLIGFFGTVFGLSHGLYLSFLATGGTTTKGFAQAIAIAFDNTLLGLGLTIVLFGVLSILRKRDEAVLLELNLLVGISDSAPDDSNVYLYDLATSLRSHESTLKDHHRELAASRTALVTPVQQLVSEIKRESVAAASQLLEGMVERNQAVSAGLLEAFSTHLTRVSGELIKNLGDNLREQQAAAASSELAELRAQMDLHARTAKLCEATHELCTRVAEAMSQRNPTEALTGAMERQEGLLREGLRTIASMKEALPAQFAAMEATREDIDSALRKIADTLADRDSSLVTSLAGALDSQTSRLREEIRRPLTIRLVEADPMDGHDGNAPAG